MNEFAQTRVLIITTDTIADRMAGPAIRAWEMSNHLSKRNAVRLLGKLGNVVPVSQWETKALSRRDLDEHLSWADIVIFQGFALHLYPQIARSQKVLVADLYDPFHLESLEMLRLDPIARRVAIAESDLRVINEQLGLCDFFICASEKQRDFWLGQLSGIGRLNPFTYDQDPSARALIDVAPFGIPSDPPNQTRRSLKGVLPGIGVSDKVLLWGGGIYNWLDPLTAIRAVGRLIDARPDVKLFFMGTAHPNPDTPKMSMASNAFRLAEELGLLDKHVFFNDGWVPYEERANYLLEADLGLSCHLDHIETTYSYRTRVLDYFWAGLPVVVTRGDSMSQLVERLELGLTVDAGDEAGLAEAITKTLEDEAFRARCKANIGAVAEDFRWDTVLKPLDEFCRTHRRAADKETSSDIALGTPGGRPKGPMWFIRRVIHYWRIGGWRLVRIQIARYLIRTSK